MQKLKAIIEPKSFDQKKREPRMTVCMHVSVDVGRRNICKWKAILNCFYCKTDVNIAHWTLDIKNMLIICIVSGDCFVSPECISCDLIEVETVVTLGDFFKC